MGLVVSLLVTRCDGVRVQVPGCRVPDDLVHVRASLQSSVVCLLSCLVGSCRATFVRCGFVVFWLAIAGAALSLALLSSTCA